jgi:predicted O-methyltransferase YrrM
VCAQDASRRLAPYGKVFMVRDYSPKAAHYFPDEFFDFVYIDARHDYSSVLSDLLAFWPKLAKGGIFAGHDFQVGFRNWRAVCTRLLVLS